MLGQLAQTMMESPMKDSLQLRPSGGAQQKKSAVTGMMLTSLVDAFTIVVIYLLLNSSASEQMDVKKGIQLPQANNSKLLDQSPVVVFKNNQFLIKGKVVSQSQLQQFLVSIKEKSKGLLKSKPAAIVIQADKSVDFKKLQPLIVASSYAGIQQVKFAVLSKD